MRRLFENPGYRIKAGTVALFTFNVIVGIILAILLAPDPLSGEFRYWLFFSILIGVSCAAYWECLFLYGFGELIENSGKIQHAVKELKDTNKLKPENETKRDTDHQKTTQKFSQGTAKVTADGMIICSVCGFEQPGNRKVCWRCGCDLDY